MKPVARRSALKGRVTVGARIWQVRPEAWRLSIPACSAEWRVSYQVAQLDDYAGQPQKRFPWQVPATLALSARVSAPDLPGTWGFGWWNDPFSIDLGMGGVGRRFPALPNAAWFIHAAPPNHLGLRDDCPGSGLLAGVFSAPRLPWPLLALGVPALPLLAFPPTARVLRRLGQVLMQEDMTRVAVDPTLAHDYRIVWTAEGVAFFVDDEPVLRTPCVPRGPLGTVLWIDSQYMAFSRDTGMRFGVLPHPGGWLELANMTLT